MGLFGPIGRVIIAGVLVVAGIAVYYVWPRNPIMRLTSARLTRVRPRLEKGEPGDLFPRSFVVDLYAALTALVENPNALAARQPVTTFTVYYRGSPVGQTVVPSHNFPAKSRHLVSVEGKLDAVKMLTTHAGELMADLISGRLTLVAMANLAAEVRILGIRRRVKVVARNDVTIDPLTLDVKESESKAVMKLFEQPPAEDPKGE